MRCETIQLFYWDGQVKKKIYIYIYSTNNSGVFLSHILLFLCVQKKDSHIKTIPAFKPIPTEMGSPESTPEKQPPGKADRHKISNKLVCIITAM